MESFQMNIRTLTLASAAAALLTTGALAQTQTTPPAGALATPPAATEPATPPAATAPSMTEKKPMTEKATGDLQFSSTLSSDQMSVNRLIGMSVYNAGDEDLGDVNDVIVDKTGNPSVAVIGVGGFLGIGEKNVGVPFERLQFAMNKDNTQIARLDVPRESLESAPNFVYSDEPDRTAATPRTQ
jgi:sporulation protein YlmC with PRC-barrel domain